MRLTALTAAAVTDSPTGCSVPDSVPGQSSAKPESGYSLKRFVPESPTGSRLRVPESPTGSRLRVPESPIGVKRLVVSESPGGPCAARRRLSITADGGGLKTLPWDLFAYMYGFITPKDVLALTLCCRDFRALREPQHFRRTNPHRIFNLTRKLYLHELHMMKKEKKGSLRGRHIYA